jgi:type II secretory pathway pseudopilin PulG
VWHRARTSRGASLVELLIVVALVALIAGVSVPQVSAGMERGRARAAARYLAARMAVARTEAVGRATAVALRFHQDPQGITLGVYADGNRNGVRARDIDALVDREIGTPVRLEDLFPGVVIGAPGDGDAPVLLGGTELLTFTPGGTATSGTIHVLGRDGSRFAVRILGVTARVRVQRYDLRSQTWVDSL